MVSRSRSGGKHAYCLEKKIWEPYIRDSSSVTQPTGVRCPLVLFVALWEVRLRDLLMLIKYADAHAPSTCAVSHKVPFPCCRSLVCSAMKLCQSNLLCFK